jgi:uracil-DNA glycosylase
MTAGADCACLCPQVSYDSSPGLREINACNVWLEQEITEISPTVIVALGGTALRALSGASLTIAATRGADIRHAGGATILASYHPSAILRPERQPRARTLAVSSQLSI